LESSSDSESDDIFAEKPTSTPGNPKPGRDATAAAGRKKSKISPGAPSVNGKGPVRKRHKSSDGATAASVGLCSSRERTTLNKSLNHG
jgi:hypothetical protein